MTMFPQSIARPLSVDSQRLHVVEPAGARVSVVVCKGDRLIARALAETEGSQLSDATSKEVRISMLTLYGYEAIYFACAGNCSLPIARQ